MQRHEALLAEDVIVPVHAHDERDDHFVSLEGGTPRAVSHAEAGVIAARHHGITTHAEAEIADDGPRRLDRRRAARAVGAGLLGALLAPAVAPRYAFAATPGDTLVCIFLRGGFDGLSALVPVADPDYYRMRGSIAVPESATVRLTDSFGMHAGMKKLEPMWKDGDLAFVPATGSPWITRSHFDDMYAAERCAPASVRTGWLGRHLASSSSAAGTFREITIGDRAVMALTTSWPTMAMTSIKDFDINCWSGYRPQMLSAIDRMYGEAGGAVNAQADKTLAAIGELDNIRSVTYAPENGAVYPSTSFGKGMSEIAHLIKAGKGVEVACIDLGDWDMHKRLGRRRTRRRGSPARSPTSPTPSRPSAPTSGRVGATSRSSPCRSSGVASPSTVTGGSTTGAATS